MQYNFQEGLLCGLLMTNEFGSYNSNKNYKPLNDPAFNYILENYTPKVEIIMTPHYTYRYYHDVSPFYSDDNFVFWRDSNSSEFRMRKTEGSVTVKGPDSYAQGTKLYSFYKAINCQGFITFDMKVWYRDGKPIIGYLNNTNGFAATFPKYHDKWKKVNGKTVYLGTICYPSNAIKDLIITQSAPIVGVLEQTYRVSGNEIYKNRITLPEGAVNQPTITVTYNIGTNYVHPSNYDSLLYDENGIFLPESPPVDWSGDPIIFPDSFEQKTYVVRGNGMRIAPDFSIATSVSGDDRIFCEMSPDEFHECELELINQQYEAAKSKIRVYDIQNFLLPKGFTNKDLPPELNRTLPKT